MNRFPLWKNLMLVLVLGSGVTTQAAEIVDPDSYRAYDIGDGTATLDVEDAVSLIYISTPTSSRMPRGLRAVGYP